MMKYSPKTKIKIYPLKLKINPIHTPLSKFILISNSKREYTNIAINNNLQTKNIQIEKEITL